jgi:hypothetical protein
VTTSFKVATAKAKKARTNKIGRPENSVGIRFAALGLIIFLLLVSASYVPTNPIMLLLGLVIATGGSYLSYFYRKERPAFVSIIPTIGIIVLFTLFFFELYTGVMYGAATATTAFVHMMAGLMALHSFDLRTRTDFSISALIGLCLLVSLTGLARDALFAVFIIVYSVLGGILLFFDSASRSRDLGPSKSVTESSATQGHPATTGNKPNQGFTLSSLAPVIVLPIVSFLAFLSLPRPESLIDLLLENCVKLNTPISANLRSQLGKGGNSQSLRGGTQESPRDSGNSYTAKGGAGGSASGQSGVASKTGKGQGIPDLNSHSPQGGNLFGHGQTPPPTKKLPAPQNNTNNATEKKEVFDLISKQKKPDALLLRLSSNKPTYLRCYSLNNFNGKMWERKYSMPGKNLLANKKLGYDLTTSNAFYVPPNLPTLELKQDIRVESSLGHTLPVGWFPQLIQKSSQNFKDLHCDSDGTLRTTEDLKRGDCYTIISQLPIYDLNVMRQLQPETLAQVDEERQEEIATAKDCLSLPPGIPGEVRELSLQIASINGNWFTRAESLCNYLRKNYQYETKIESQSANLKVEDFLFTHKIGDCRHFATAFVALCRSQGIPARTVIGFLPGELNEKSGYYEIKGKHTHAWAEVYIPYWNWVPFDPTPSGQLPLHQEGDNPMARFIKSGLANPFAQSYSHRRPKNQELSLNPNADSQKKTDKNPLNFDFGKNQGNDSGKLNVPGLEPLDTRGIQQLIRGLLIGSLSLLFVGLVFLYFKLRGKKDDNSQDGPNKPSTIIFLEVINDLKRWEITRAPAETADELSSRVSDNLIKLRESGKNIPDELPEAVNEFMELYCADRFGRANNLDSLRLTANRIKHLATTAGPEKKNGYSKN